MLLAASFYSYSNTSRRSHTPSRFIFSDPGLRRCRPGGGYVAATGVLPLLPQFPNCARPSSRSFLYRPPSSRPSSSSLHQPRFMNHPRRVHIVHTRTPRLVPVHHHPRHVLLLSRPRTSPPRPCSTLSPMPRLCVARVWEAGVRRGCCSRCGRAPRHSATPSPAPTTPASSLKLGLGSVRSQGRIPLRIGAQELTDRRERTSRRRPCYSRYPADPAALTRPLQADASFRELTRPLDHDVSLWCIYIPCPSLYAL